MKNYIQRPFKYSAFGLILMVGLNGCITHGDYVEPTSALSAKLTFVAGPGAIAANVAQQADSDCKHMNHIANLRNKDASFILTFVKTVPEKTIKIPADTPFRFQIADGNANVHCRVALEFDPLVEAEYKMIWHFSFDSWSCGVKLLKKHENKEWVQDFNMRTVKLCTGL